MLRTGVVQRRTQVSFRRANLAAITGGTARTPSIRYRTTDGGVIHPSCKTVEVSFRWSTIRAYACLALRLSLRYRLWSRPENPILPR
jgi:hypothetical protein